MTKRPSILNLKNVTLIVVLLLSLTQNLRNYTQITELEIQIESQADIIAGYTSTIDSLENDLDEANSLNDVLNNYIQTLEDALEEQCGEILTSDQASSSSSARTITIDLIGTCIRVFDGDTFARAQG